MPVVAPTRTAEHPLVLLVEDSRQHAELVEDMLFEVHPELRLVHHARVETAEELVRLQRPDCILMDLGLPDAQGLAGMRRLLEAAPEVPIVVLTGRDDEDVATEAVKEGAQDYLVKSQSDGPLIDRAIRYAIERKRAQVAQSRHAAEVRAFAEYQRDFVAAASHELRTPLTAIMGYVELLHEDPDADADERHGHTTAALRNCRRLLELVEDLLTVNRMETTSIPMQIAPIAVDALMGVVEDDARALCERKGLRLVVEAGGSGAMVLADRAHTQEVLENLVGNAVKFTPAGGDVRLSSGVEDGRGVLTVADTGIGIPSADLHRIFDRFYRASNSVRAAAPGTGLGLAIALSLVEAQDGRLAVQSAPGEGSVFTVGLPLAAPGA